MVRGALVSGAGERGNRVSGDTRGAANVGQASTKEFCQVSPSMTDGLFTIVVAVVQVEWDIIAKRVRAG
jgi:hypothetical protein